MRILVLNGGSSSIKFSVYETGEGEPRAVVEGALSGIGGKARLEVKGGRTDEVKAEGTDEAVGIAFKALDEAGMSGVEAVGYRVVHPGAKLDKHQRITAEVLQDLKDARAFAPLHEPEAIAVIHAGMKRFPGVMHYACFDTVFHQTMPEEATVYAIPAALRARGVRRYGFHGLSCESIVRQFGTKVPGRMVIAHLGSGCSVTAVVEGRSIDTTMGLTPTGGVVMGTRPGDLDPGAVLYLVRQQEGEKEVAVAAVEGMFNHDSGMVALSGLANDMKAVREAAESGDQRARLALKVFTRGVRKAIGGYCWLMGGVDAIVFAGGIGEHDATTRAEVLSRLEGILHPMKGNGDADGTKVCVMEAQEDLMIAVHVAKAVRGQ